MVNIKHGEVKDGRVVYFEPVGLPEGTQVTVVIEPLPESGKPADLAEGPDLDSLAFIEMWADREDMQDSTAWVRQERDRKLHPSS